MTVRRSNAFVLAAVTLAGVGYATTDARAAYTTSYSAARALHGDFNGDGYGDLVAASANARFSGGDYAGAIQVVYGGAGGLQSSTARVLTQDTRGVPGAREAGDMWGAAVAVGDFNGDGYSDLAVGSPGEALGGIQAAGMVTVLYGSAQGLTGTGAKGFTQNTNGVPGVAERGDRFGSGLVAGDFNGDHHDDLAVGILGETLGRTTARRGMVEVFYGSRSGITASRVGVFDSKTAGLRDDTHTSGGTWGSYLAAGDFDSDGRSDLALTDATAKVDGRVTGYLQVLYGGSSGLGVSRAHRWSAASQGLGGRSFTGQVVTGHFDGDRYHDVVVAGRSATAGSGSGFTVLYGSSSGIRSARNQYMQPAGSGLPAAPLAAGNLVGSLQDDVVWSGGPATTQSAKFGIVAGSASGLTRDGSLTFDYAAGPASTDGDAYRSVTAAAVLKPQGRRSPCTLAVTDGPVEAGGDQVASNSVYLYRASGGTVQPNPTAQLTASGTGFRNGVYATALA